MIEVRRLLAAGALLAIAAIWTTTGVWGDPAKPKEMDKDLAGWQADTGGDVIVPVENDAAGESEIEKNSFTGVPVVTYQHLEGVTYFALQVQPKLEDEPARPTDYLVIVDTSASKALGYLAAAVHVTKELAKRIGAEDRLCIWTANIKAKDLTRGFKSGKDKDVAAALKDLEDEVPLGAVDLKKVLRESLAGVEAKASRRRALIYLGDGKSVADPVDSAERSAIAELLIKKQMPFHAVPLGPSIDAKNLHGLVSSTGGKVIRTGLTEKAEKFLPRLLKDVAEPVLYASEFKLPAAATEVLPSKMPPLRRDVPTLVVGKLAEGTKTIDWSVKGESAGKAARAEGSAKVPPADPDMFFLHGLVSQWKAKPEQAALLAADRTLGYSHKQATIALDQVLSQGETALEQNKLDAARKLFDKAVVFAPHSRRAKAGNKLADEIQAGKKTRAQILEEVRSARARREVEKVVDGKRTIIVLDDKDDRNPDDLDKKPDPLDDVQARRKIAFQQADALVKEAVDQANRLVRTSPVEAMDILKRAKAGLEGNDVLDPKDLASLRARLDRGMESVDRVGRTVSRDQAQAAAMRAAADARLDVRRVETLAQDRIRERMRVFHNLMDQARELEAMKQADTIRKDLINEGLPVPPAVSAAYRVGQSSFYLREVREMRRVREQKFLEVLHEVERSHVPFPDEPPIEFPSSETLKKITRGRFDNWADFSKFRINRYSQASFGADVPGRFLELRELLKETIDWKELDDRQAKLRDVLDLINKNETDGKRKFRGVSWGYNDKAFRKAYGDGMKDIRDEVVGVVEGGRMSLGGLLKRVLSKITVGGGGATYIIRRDQIEITTEEAQVKEKALRVYPVADLVYPTLMAFNPLAVGQTATILGSLGQQGLAGGGLALGGGGLALGAGGLGALGALGGGALGALGALGGGALGAGGLALGAGGLAVGAAVGLQVGAAVGAMAGGPAGLQVGAGGNCQGAINLGVGGGFPGFTGGQLGQLGNLGGQFGMQGGNQNQALITLIRQVVGKPRDWLMQYNPITGQPCNPLDDEKTEGAGILGEDNQLGFYEPAFALVVKGTSRLHSRESNLVFAPTGAADGKGDTAVGDALVKIVGPADDKAKGIDAREVWQNALAKGIEKPGIVIAAADFLVLNRRFDHAAEFLKANLRQGIMVQPWVYKSLSLALREGGGSAEDIERAEVSAADMEPMDAKSYLAAARALAEDKAYARALAFCKQAARLEPGTPFAYAEAARLAEISGDAKAMAWAASHLLKHDWPVRNDEFRQTALERVEALSRKLGKADADMLRKAVDAGRRRDLVIKVVWQGTADLDLKVEEPAGSVCNVIQKQSIGGGTLLADSLSSASETYAAAEAFSGEYKVSVEKVWGKPLGGKAQLKIIRHQGTPEESEELIPIKIDSNLVGPFKVKLEKGRRTEVAYVPPPEAFVPPTEDPESKKDGADQVLTKLRNLADPEVTGTGIAGGVAGAAPRTAWRPSASKPETSATSRTAASLYQSRVRALTSTGVDVTAQAVLSSDRRSVRVTVRPVFETMNATKPVTVTSPVVPGND